MGENLKARGVDNIVLRDPGSSNLGEKIRDILLHDDEIHMNGMTQALLFMAAREHMMHSIVLPALDKGQVVILDRSIVSTIAYQTVQMNNDDDARWEELQSMVIELAKNWPISTLYYLQVTPATAAQRISGKQLDKIERGGESFLKEVAKIYDDVTSSLTASHIIPTITINANYDEDYVAGWINRLERNFL